MTKKLFFLAFIIFLFNIATFAQAPGSAPAYPGALDTRGSFLAGSNRANSTIANLGGISAVATTVSVATNPTLFPTDGGAITIDNEILYYTTRVGSALNGLLRGQDGTVAASHNSGATISMKIIAQHVNGHSDALIELERKLGTGADIAAANEFLIGIGTGATAYSPLTSGHVTTALGFTPITNARQITTTLPLSGGGALTSDLSLTVAAASASASGVVNTTIQSFAGQKTVLSPLLFLNAPTNETGYANKGASPYLFGGSHSQADTASAGVGGELSFNLQTTRTGGAVGNATVAYGFGFTEAGLNDLYGLYGIGRFTTNLSAVSGSINFTGFRSYLLASPPAMGSGALNLYPIWAQAETFTAGVNLQTIQADTNNSSGVDAPDNVSTLGRSTILNFNHGPGNHNTVDMLSEATPSSSSFRGWDVQADVYPQTVLNYQNVTFTPQGTINVTFNNGAVTGTAGIAAQTLTSLTSSGTTATATKTSHGFSTGNRITIAGATPTTYNGVFVITVTGANTFTYTLSTTATSPATGTITATRVGTKFTTEYVVGHTIIISGVYYTVSGITDAVNMSITPVYAGSTASNLIPTTIPNPVWLSNRASILARNFAGTAKYRSFFLTTGDIWSWDADARGTVAAGDFTISGLLKAGTTPVTLTDSAGKILSAALNTVSATVGGTGQTVYAVGDILYASTTTALSKLADVATGSVLVSGGVGTAPSYSNTPTVTTLTATTSMSSPLASFTTSVTSPIVYGGTSPGSTLTLNGTSGVAATAAHVSINPSVSGALPGTVFIGTSNGTSLTGGGSTDILHLQGSDASLPLLVLDSYGSVTGGSLTFRHALGTAASPVASAVGNTVANFGGRPYFTSGTGSPAFAAGNRAAITFRMLEGATATNQGMYVSLETTQSTTTVRRQTELIGLDKNLTDATAVSLFEMDLNSGTNASVTGAGTIEYNIVATNGTDFQSFSGSVSFSGVNKTGTPVSNITNPDGSSTASTAKGSFIGSTGTLVPVWTVLNGSNKITIQLNADTSLTGLTTFKVYYRLINNSIAAITLL